MVKLTRPVPPPINPARYRTAAALARECSRMNNQRPTFWQTIIWQFSLGPSVTVPWPTSSASHIHQWLIDNVGKQGTDWRWRGNADQIRISLHKKHANLASIILLRWL